MGGPPPSHASPRRCALWGGRSRRPRRRRADACLWAQAEVRADDCGRLLSVGSVRPRRHWLGPRGSVRRGVARMTWFGEVGSSTAKPLGRLRVRRAPFAMAQLCRRDRASTSSTRLVVRLAGCGTRASENSRCSLDGRSRAYPLAWSACRGSRCRCGRGWLHQRERAPAAAARERGAVPCRSGEHSGRGLSVRLQ